MNPFAIEEEKSDYTDRNEENRITSNFGKKSGHLLQIKGSNGKAGFSS